MIAAAAALALTAGVPSQGLVAVIGVGEETTWHVDRTTLVREGDSALARVVIEHNRRGRPHLIEWVRLRVDCRTRRYRPLAVASFAPDGRRLRAEPVAEADFPAARAQPGAQVSSVVSYMCGDPRRHDYRLNSALQFTD